MIRIRKGIVKQILKKNDRISILNVFFDGRSEKTINYTNLTGDVKTDDVVYINTTANYLGLGTGGYNYVIINETRGGNIDIDDFGHIMKLRYTPIQIKCNCASEKSNTNSNYIDSYKGLDNMVIITGELHSMLAPVACCLKYLDNNRKIVYIMTDGGSLPIDLSFSVRELKEMKIIDGTITSGNAFGGDLEAVNIYDALIIAKNVLKCDIAVITMGPGIVGTGTKYGFTGIEQGYIIDAINTLKGIPVFIPRLSFQDSRKRHYGISHHTLTILSEIAKTKANVVFPVFDEKKNNILLSQIRKYCIDSKHTISFIECDVVFKSLDYYNISVNTMGRSLYKDKEFFITCGCSALYANEILHNKFLHSNF